MDPGQKKDPFRKKPLNEFVFYVGIGIQLAITMLIFAEIGNFFDTYFEFKRPW